jgi:predicted dehydrogenase
MKGTANMTPRVRVGFLGAGNLNTIQHFPAIASCEDAEFYAVCDLNEDLLDRRANLYKPRYVTTDYDKLLADGKVDLVWIAAHPELQEDLARRALRAGKHVFVEKPMSETAKGCLELGRLARRKGVRLFTGFNRRYAPAYVDVRSILSEMKRPPMVTYRLADDSFGRASEVFDRPQLLDETCHAFDIISHLVGSEPVRVCTFSASRNNDLVSIQYANGAVASITSSIQSSMAWPKERLEVLMDNAALSVDDFVELQTANVPGWGCMTKRYEGFEYPGWLSGYKERMQWEGLSAVLAFRRRWLEVITEAGVPNWQPGPQADRDRAALVESHRNHMPPVNYMVNKGWRNADLAILKSLRTGASTAAAGATDAARAIAMAEAAVKSARTGKVVSLDPSW